MTQNLKEAIGLLASVAITVSFLMLVMQLRTWWKGRRNRRRHDVP